LIIGINGGVIRITILYWSYAIIDKVLLILEWLVIIRCILSWIPHSPSNRFIRIIYDITEPLLRPFRKIRLGNQAMMVDFAPFFAVLAIVLIKSVILWPLYKLIANLIV